MKLNDDSIKDKKFKSLSEYEESLKQMKTKGFNLVFGNVKTLEFKYFRYENSEDNLPTMSEPIKLERNVVYGLCNGPLDSWDKVRRGKHMFSKIMDEY